MVSAFFARLQASPKGERPGKVGERWQPLGDNFAEVLTVPHARQALLRRLFLDCLLVLRILQQDLFNLVQEFCVESLFRFKHLKDFTQLDGQ